MEDRLFNPGVITLVFISFVFGVGEFIIIGIANEIAIGVDTSIGNIMFLISIFAVAYAIASPVLTFATSKFNKFWVFISFLVVFFIANLLSYLANDYAVLAVSRILTAAVSGAGLASALSFVSDVTEVKRYIPKVIAFVFAGFSIACTIGLPMGVIIDQNFGWRMTFAAVLALAVIAIILALLFLPKEQHPSEETWGQQSDIVSKSPVAILKDPRILLTMAFSILGMGAFYIVFAPIESLMKECLGFDAGQVSIGLLIFGIAALIGNILTSRFAEKGGYRALCIVMIVQIIIFAVLGVALNNVISGMLAIICIGLVVYLMNAPNQVHYMEIAGRWYPNSIRLASSFNPMSFNIGIALGSFLSGILIQSFKLSELGYFAAILSIVALFVGIAIVMIEKNPEKRTSVYEGSQKQ